jgi:uncharacterized protein (DUF2141 family)
MSGTTVSRPTETSKDCSDLSSMEAAVDSLGCSASSRLGDEQAKATLQLDLEEYKKRAGYLSAKVFPSNQRSSQKEVEDPEPTCTEVTDLKRGRQATRSFQTIESRR